VEGKHEAILMKWIIDMNSGINHLAFECQKKTFGHKLGILIWGLDVMQLGEFLKQFWQVISSFNV